MKLGVTLDILNQKDTPAFYADTLANRPAAGFTGRVFISTDTLDLYRDTGTTWVLLSPSSTGTITGSGAAGQVSYFSGASSIAGSNDLFFDSVNGHLGIGTITPSTALTIFHDQNQIIQLNQTTATNDTKIAFQNSGTPLWRIGNSYNAGANDYGIFDVVGAIQPLTIKKTTGQTYIGAQTTSSGRLVVNDATGDNHIVVIGATAPSLRINNSGSGATKQIGIGLATATNNFIQGAADRDMAIFNGSTTPSPILFGIYGTTNIQEAARISAARNFLIGTPTDAGPKLQINGTTKTYQGLVSTGSIGGYASGRSDAQIEINNAAGGHALMCIYNQQNAEEGAISFDALLSNSTNRQSAAIFTRFVNDINTFNTYNAVFGVHTVGATTDKTNLLLFSNNSVVLCGGDTISSPWNTLPSANTLTVNGSTTINASTTINSNLTINNSSTNAIIDIIRPSTSFGAGLRLSTSSTQNWLLGTAWGETSSNFVLYNVGLGAASIVTNISTNNVLIGSTTDNGAKLQVNGSITINNAVTASVLNTVTNKVSIVIGGVQYYLLASTSAV
jgi:hypothetical protein